MKMIQRQPLAEVFGFSWDDLSDEASRHRRLRLCPFNNRVPNCTKDRARDPLGVCSIFYEHSADTQAVITCPIRFRENWLIAENAAMFFFPPGAAWTSLSEVRLNDRHGRSAGNIDLVLVAYDASGRVVDFGALEVQAVYISGNVRRPFETYLADPEGWSAVDWSHLADYYPRPDFLSSSRKRLVPQMLFKGGIMKTWGKKQAVAVQSTFFDTLPALPEAPPEEADIAWFVYDLVPDGSRLRLVLQRTVYTAFWPALSSIITPEAGDLDAFMNVLQQKLDDVQGSHAPDAPTLTDLDAV